MDGDVNISVSRDDKTVYAMMLLLWNGPMLAWFLHIIFSFQWPEPASVSAFLLLFRSVCCSWLSILLLLAAAAVVSRRLWAASRDHCLGIQYCVGKQRITQIMPDGQRLEGEWQNLASLSGRASPPSSWSTRIRWFLGDLFGVAPGLTLNFSDGSRIYVSRALNCGTLNHRVLHAIALAGPENSKLSDMLRQYQQWHSRDHQPLSFKTTLLIGQAISAVGLVAVLILSSVDPTVRAEFWTWLLGALSLFILSLLFSAIYELGKMVDRRAQKRRRDSDTGGIHDE